MRLSVGILECVHTKPYGIDCFNTLHLLEELEVKFLNYDYLHVPAFIIGNLSLPVLQWLKFGVERGYEDAGLV